MLRCRWGDGLAEKFPQPPSLVAHAVLPWPVMVFVYFLYFGFWLLLIAVMAFVGMCLLLWATGYSIWLRAREPR